MYIKYILAYILQLILNLEYPGLSIWSISWHIYPFILNLEYPD